MDFTIGELFAGIGGFGLGLEMAGLGKVIWQVEIDDFCNKVLEKHWPKVRRYRDVRTVGKYNLEPVDIICGGAPCPIRSRARANRPTKHPDLSEYFLLVVGQMRPWWVLRENVPASDDIDFQTALDLLGYRTVIIRANSAPFTGQNRTRDFIIGCSSEAGLCGFSKLYLSKSSLGFTSAREKTSEGYPCLNTHAHRYDSRDGLIWEGRGALRIADSEERVRLAGFPSGWLDGLSKTRVARLTGNAVVPELVCAIGEIMMEWIRSGELNGN